MKNSKRGEIATILTLGTLIVLGVVSLISSVTLNKNKNTTTTHAASNKACGDNPEGHPPGFTWKADCSDAGKCVTKDTCPANPDRTVNADPKETKWCYGFADKNGGTNSTDDWRCMMLVYEGRSTNPTAAPAPTSSTGGNPTATPANNTSTVIPTPPIATPAPTWTPVPAASCDKCRYSELDASGNTQCFEGNWFNNGSGGKAQCIYPGYVKRVDCYGDFVCPSNTSGGAPPVASTRAPVATTAPAATAAPAAPTSGQQQQPDQPAPTADQTAPVQNPSFTASGRVKIKGNGEVGKLYAFMDIYDTVGQKHLTNRSEGYGIQKAQLFPQDSDVIYSYRTTSKVTSLAQYDPSKLECAVHIASDINGGGYYVTSKPQPCKLNQDMTFEDLSFDYYSYDGTIPFDLKVTATKKFSNADLNGKLTALLRSTPGYQNACDDINSLQVQSRSMFLVSIIDNVVVDGSPRIWASLDDMTNTSYVEKVSTSVRAKDKNSVIYDSEAYLVIAANIKCDERIYSSDGRFLVRLQSVIDPNNTPEGNRLWRYGQQSLNYFIDLTNITIQKQP